MNALVRKEIRMLLPAWAVAMVLVIGTICLSLVSRNPVWGNPTWMVLGLVAGTLLMALLPFGQECSLGTFSYLLAQPVPRRRIWEIKTRVLAVAMLSVLIAYLIGIGLRTSVETGAPSGWMLALSGSVITMAAFAGGLWTTLLLRQVAAGFWCTLLLPLVLLMITGGIWGRLHHPADTIVIVALLASYSVAAWWWARQLFFRAQDTQWTGGTITLPRMNWLGAMGRSPVHRASPIAALVRKELQLHQSAYLVAALLLLIHLIVLFARFLSTDPQGRDGFFQLIVDAWWVLWLALPLIIGAACTAEERRLETHQSQLCLPVKRRTQTVVKLGLALVLGVCLGGLLPALLEGLGAALGAANHILELTRGVPMVSFLEFLWPMCLASAAIVLVSFYASAVTRHTLQAIGAAVPIGVALTALTFWAVLLELRDGDRSSALIGWIGVPVLLVTVLVLAFHGASRLRAGWSIWWRHALGLVLVCAFIVLATAAVHDRVWERVARLEPRAGAAQLVGPIRPQIETDQANIWVLLPDGRLWTASRYEEEVAYHYYEGRTHTPMVLRVPQGGTFIGPTNWIALAGTHIGIAGLQSDGTLWRISADKGMEQIGTASDWKSVVAGHGFFLALKGDGTLWGWGRNFSGQLGPGPKSIVDPTRIGMEDDWVQVFASAATSTGIKRDGSVWRWGHLDSVPHSRGHGFIRSSTTSNPVHWPWDASDWRIVDIIRSWEPSFDAILHEDGTLWVAGFKPRNLLGHSSRVHRGHQVRVAVEPIRLDRHANWIDLRLSGNNRSIAAIRANQLLVQSDFRRRTIPWLRRIWNPSRRSDWIAITPWGDAAFVALAADGTLAMWGYWYREPAGIAGLLAPSRKPWWSVNVLDAAQTLNL
jgi:hypothetical protein